MKISRFIAASALAAAVASPAAFAQPGNPALPTPNAVVYVQQLPTPAELAKYAAAQGMTVAQISQTSNQITIVYKLVDGKTNTVAYQPLSAVDATEAAARTVAVPTPAPTTTVVYTTPAPVYASPAYSPFYDPYWGWYAPVGISLGFGFGGGWGDHDGWGGFHHGWGDHDGGGFRGGFRH